MHVWIRVEGSGCHPPAEELDSEARITVELFVVIVSDTDPEIIHVDAFPSKANPV
jgi:hypothetical protein